MDSLSQNVRTILTFIHKFPKELNGSLTESVCIIFNLTDSLPAWLRWGFWLSPVSYAEIGVSVTEFLAPRWEKVKMRPKFYYYVMLLFLGKIKDESVTYI